MADTYVFFDINALLLTQEYISEHRLKIPPNFRILTVEKIKVYAINLNRISAMLGSLQAKNIKVGFLTSGILSNSHICKSILKSIFGLMDDVLKDAIFISNTQYGSPSISISRRVQLAQDHQEGFSKDANVTLVSTNIDQEESANKKGFGFIHANTIELDYEYLNELEELQNGPVEIVKALEQHHSKSRCTIC